MQAGFVNAYSTQNIGDAAIYSALATLSPQTVVAAFADVTPEDIPQVQVQPTLPTCDVYISVGGDIFNNARESLVTKAFLQNLGQLYRHSAATFLFGQSIPRSCHGLSFFLLTQALKRLAAVAVRDAQSHERLTQAGVVAKLSYDAAFALEVSEAGKATAQSLMQSQNLDPGRVALISLRTFNSAMYGSGGQRFIQQMVELCQELQTRGHQPVLLLQSQIPADLDLAVATQICSQVPGVAIFDPFLPSRSLPNWQIVMGALAISHLIIGVRYHTSVLALACGRIPFNLYYSNKGQDLTQRLGIPGCLIADFQPYSSIETIEKTSLLDFDHQSIRQIVQNDFQDCFVKASRSIS